jgi:hypothetical protein
MDKGILQVHVAFDRDELVGVGFPVVVRQMSMAVVERNLTGRPIEVEPSDYLVSVTLPGGEELFERVEVGAGESKIVTLMPPNVDQVSAPQFSRRHATQQSYARSSPPTIPHSREAEGYPVSRMEPVSRNTRRTDAPGDSIRRGVLPARMSQRSSVARSDRTIFLRLLSGDPFQPPLHSIGGLKLFIEGDDARSAMLTREPLDNLPPLMGGDEPGSTPTDGWISPHSYRLALMMPHALQPFQTFWLRITSPPDRTRFVMVPALRGERCILLLTQRGVRSSFDVDFHLVEPSMNVLLQYRQHSEARQVRTMLMQNEIKQRAYDTPLYRALIGYLALRFGLPEPDEEIDKICDFEVLDFPDARIIRGELLARQGRSAEARALFARADEGGLPIFSDGMGLLSSRIPQFMRMTEAKRRFQADDASEVHPELAQVWNRLRPFIRSADLKPVVSTLRGNVLTYKD